MADNTPDLDALLARVMEHKLVIRSGSTWQLIEELAAACRALRADAARLDWLEAHCEVCGNSIENMGGSADFDPNVTGVRAAIDAARGV